MSDPVILIKDQDRIALPNIFWVSYLLIEFYLSVARKKNGRKNMDGRQVVSRL